MTCRQRGKYRLVVEKRARRLMLLMDGIPPCQKPNILKAAKRHAIYLNLLRTKLLVRRGLHYRMAAIGWHARDALSCLISKTLGARL